MELYLISIVPPSEFEETDIQKLIKRAIEKDGSSKKPLKYAIYEELVWMPYYRIELEYKHLQQHSVTEFGETTKGETALNAMFSAYAQGENELFLLFRPNYLKYDLVARSPESDEIIGPAFATNFDEILSGFVKRLNEVEDELHKLRTMLNKRYMHIARMRILPMISDLKEGKELSEKIAKLSALKDVLNMCLNSDEDTKAIKVLGNSTFFYPTLVAALEYGENEAERFVIVDLVKRGSIKRLNLDEALTRLCNSNNLCKEILAKSVGHA